MGDGIWKAADGRQQMGDGRWETAEGRQQILETAEGRQQIGDGRGEMMEFIVISLKIMALFKQSTDLNFLLQINGLELQLTINDLWKLLLELVIAINDQQKLFILVIGIVSRDWKGL